MRSGVTDELDVEEVGQARQGGAALLQVLVFVHHLTQLASHPVSVEAQSFILLPASREICLDTGVATRVGQPCVGEEIEKILVLPPQFGVHSANSPDEVHIPAQV